jgi:hypothetical protein
MERRCWACYAFVRAHEVRCLDEESNAASGATLRWRPQHNCQVRNGVSPHVCFL